MPTAHPILTGILIGGKSARMGTDKAILPWRNATIIETIVQTARTISPSCVLLGQQDNLPHSLKEMRTLPDPYPNAGPLAGLAALLDHAESGWCLLLSCDIPDITTDALTHLATHIAPHTKAIAYTTPNPPTTHATAALYHTDIRPQVHNAITTNNRALHRLIRTLPHTLIPADPQTQRALHNINTQSDYAPNAVDLSGDHFRG